VSSPPVRSLSVFICVHLRFLLCVLCALSAVASASAQEADLPDARPVPDVQVIPLPDHQASFQHLGRELTRYWFSPLQPRPFWYPMAGPEGRSLSRMGHPHDPVGHSHHNSVWISHHDVCGVSFWNDRGEGRIVHQAVDRLEDGPRSASMLSRNAWVHGPDGKVLMSERRRAEVEVLDAGHWRLLIDLQLEAPPHSSVTLGATPFGIIGVRMAKTIGVLDGGGRILSSEGQVNEKDIFRKPARWVDYSGPITAQGRAGIALMDHPANPGHPCPFHVRDDGWMGVCLTLDRPLVIEPGHPLRLRYALWVHPGVPQGEAVQKAWDDFARGELPALTPPPKP